MKNIKTVSLPERVVCLRVELHRFGVTRKVKDETKNEMILSDCDKRTLSLSQNILDAPELKEIRAVGGRIAAFLKNWCLPTKMGSGTYLIPQGLIEYVDQKLVEFQAEINYLADAFIARYPDLKEAAQQTRGSLYRDEDYPPAKEVRAAFGMEFEYFTLSIPGSLEELSQSIYKRESEKLQKLWDSTQEECMALLRAQFKALVDHAADRLETDTKTGQRKKFHDTVLTNVSQFLETFHHRNIADDKELQSLVKKMRKLTDGVSGPALRTDDQLRVEVQKGFAKMAKQLSNVVDRPERLISFGDD